MSKQTITLISGFLSTAFAVGASFVVYPFLFDYEKPPTCVEQSVDYFVTCVTVDPNYGPIDSCERYRREFLLECREEAMAAK